MSAKTKRDQGLLAAVEQAVSQLDQERPEDTAAIPTIQHAQVLQALQRNREMGDLLMSEIDPDPDQVRTINVTGDEAFEDLKRSIQEHGVLQPIRVRWIPAAERFRIVAGHRRFLAARELGIDRIPAVVKDVDDRSVVIQQLVENLQRKSLNPIEEAKGFQRWLASNEDATHEDLAARIGKSRTYVTNTLRVLEKLTTAEQQILAECSPANMPGKSLILEVLEIPDPKTRRSILSGQLTRQEARERAQTFKKRPLGRPTNTVRSKRLHEPYEATVTVTFHNQRDVNLFQVIDALESAAETWRKETEETT